MTLRDIAYKNVKENLNKYVMYYLSNALVVMVFFIFANFVSNPQVENVNTLGSMGQTAKSIIYLCELVIVVFSLVFTNYSISNFLKSREKEFGLLSLFGFTKNQIRSYVMFENLIVASAAIATGLLAGVLFSKLFLMAITIVLALDVNIPFSISGRALIITLISFLVLFQAAGFKVSLSIKSKNIAGLLKGGRVPKPVPVFSRARAMLSILLIAAGYAMAVYSGLAIIFTMFPVLILVVSGTYLLYSQFSVFFTERLKKNKGIYYKGINMISLSQIVYKLRDNAKILFIASTLSAVTLTASVSVYSLQKTIIGNIKEGFPHDFNIVEMGQNPGDASISDEIEERIKAYGCELKYKNRVVLIQAVNPRSDIANATNNKRDFYIMSNSDYNQLVSQLGKRKVKLQNGEVLIRTYNIMGKMESKYFMDEDEFLNLEVNDKSLKLRIKDEINEAL
jgi:putative ABC transport system permease protein